MELAPDFPAILLGKEAVKRLNMLLSPPDTLHKDVRSLSDYLGFSNDEIVYIFNKQYPFVYMLDQWLKREGDAATLKTMHKKLVLLRRLDAAEIVESVILDLDGRDPKEIAQSLEQHNRQLQRSASTTTLCTVPQHINSRQSPIFQHQQKNSGKFNVPGQVVDLPKDKRKVPADAPNVFVVYFTDNEKHLRNIEKFIKYSRKHGIDATADMYEATKSSVDRGFYIYSRLISAEYVFVICSPSLSMYDSKEDTSEKDKETSFIMKLILDEIYDNAGINAKYIPILLPKCTEKDVPFILKGSTIYKMPTDFADLERRVFKIEKYKLAPIPKKKKNLKPKEISL